MLRVLCLFWLAIMPAWAQGGFLAVNLNQNQVVGGATVGCTVAISSPAPPGGTVVNLWCGDDVQVPPQVVIPAGATYTGFSVVTGATSQPLYVRIQARTADAQRTTYLQVMPPGQASASEQTNTGLQLYKQYPDVGPVYGSGIPYYYPYGYNYGYGWGYPYAEPWARPEHFDSDGYPMMHITGGRR